MNAAPSQQGQRRTALILTCGLVAMLGVSLFLSSGKAGSRDSARLRVLCSFLPVYVHVLNVAGDVPGVAVEMLLPGDLGCPHDYALRPADMVRINKADLFILNGLEAEPFVPMLMIQKPRVQVMTISDDVEPIAACDHEDHDAHEGQGAHEHHHELNPHVWASPVQAARQARTLGRKLALADPAHAERYQANAEAYAKRLEALAGHMQQAAGNFRGRNIVTFHDAFAYLARDLGLNVVATLTVDPQTGISARHRADLARIIRDQNVAAIFYERAYSDRVALSLAAETGVPAYPLNPFNFIEGPADADSYRRVMEANLTVLTRALGSRP